MLARVARDLTAMDERKRPKQTSDRHDDEPAPQDIEELRESLARKLEDLVARDKARVSGDDQG